MRKLILLLIIVGLIGVGCTHRGVVQNEAPAPKTAPAPAVVKKTSSAPTAENVKTQENIRERELTQMQRLKNELQSKLKDIHFNFDKSDLEGDAKPVLRDIANILTKNQKLKILIEGNCDERGTREYNLALGDKRANSAKQYLISVGVPSANIETVSYGKEKPICTQSTEECWAKNRRDHFVLN